MRSEKDQGVNIHIHKYRGGGRHLHRLGKNVCGEWREDEFTKASTKEKYDNRVVWSSLRSTVKDSPIDGALESDECRHPRSDHIGDMVLKPENAVFQLTLKTIGTVKHCGIDFSVADEHVYVRSETYNQKLEEFNRTNELAEDSDRRMTTTEFWNSVMAEAFETSGSFLSYCNACLRMFYSPLSKRNRLSICQYCLEKHVTDRCDERENRVMREVSGHIVGLSTDDEMRAFSDGMPCKKKRKGM